MDAFSYTRNTRRRPSVSGWTFPRRIWYALYGSTDPQVYRSTESSRFSGQVCTEKWDSPKTSTAVAPHGRNWWLTCAMTSKPASRATSSRRAVTLSALASRARAAPVAASWNFPTSIVPASIAASPSSAAAAGGPRRARSTSCGSAKAARWTSSE